MRPHRGNRGRGKQTNEDGHRRAAEKGDIPFFDDRSNGPSGRGSRGPSGDFSHDIDDWMNDQKKGFLGHFMGHIAHILRPLFTNGWAWSGIIAAALIPIAVATDLLLVSLAYAGKLNFLPPPLHIIAGF